MMTKTQALQESLLLWQYLSTNADFGNKKLKKTALEAVGLPSTYVAQCPLCQYAYEQTPNKRDPFYFDCNHCPAKGYWGTEAYTDAVDDCFCTNHDNFLAPLTPFLEWLWARSDAQQKHGAGLMVALLERVIAEQEAGV